MRTRIHVAAAAVVLAWLAIPSVRAYSAYRKKQEYERQMVWPSDLGSVPESILPHRNKTREELSREGTLTNQQSLAFWKPTSGLPLPQRPEKAESRWSAAWSSSGYPSGSMVSWVRLSPQKGAEYVEGVYQLWAAKYGPRIIHRGTGRSGSRYFDGCTTGAEGCVGIYKTWREDWNYGTKWGWEEEAYTLEFNPETGDVVLHAYYGPEKAVNR